MFVFWGSSFQWCKRLLLQKRFYAGSPQLFSTLVSQSPRQSVARNCRHLYTSRLFIPIKYSRLKGCAIFVGIFQSWLERNNWKLCFCLELVKIWKVPRCLLGQEFWWQGNRGFAMLNLWYPGITDILFLGESELWMSSTSAAKIFALAILKSLWFVKGD